MGSYKKGILLYVLAIVIVIYPVIWILSMIDVILSKNVKENQEDPFSERKNVVIISFLTAPISLAFLMFLFLQVFNAFSDTFLAQDRTVKEMTIIEEAIIDYEKHYGKYPHSIEELVSIKPIREGWQRDYWKKEYHYSSTNSEFVLMSSGKDRQLFTEDDIKLSGQVFK